MSIAYLADISLTELTPIFAIFTGMLLGFYGITKFILIQANSDRKDDRAERQKLVAAINDMALSNRDIAVSVDKQARATEAAAEEAEKRNGHLAEISTQGRDTILTAINTIGEQHVKHQVVDSQEIKKEEK